jgi:tRNA pseudouridine55 synthase
MARRVLKTRAIGHAGTLDPMASGVLVLLVGEATKLTPYLTLDEKEYRATISFGRSTDTLDAEGTMVTERAFPPEAVSRDRVLAALLRETERTEQVPPAFSAISVDGKRAHRLARSGRPPDLPPRPVRVASASLIALTEGSATVDLTVSKGYYVRSFARDLGEHLGVASHLSALERRRSGPYHIDEAAPWPPPPSTPLPPLVSLEEAARRVLDTVTLTDVGVERAAVGKPLAPEHFTSPPPNIGCSAWLAGDRLLAIGEANGEGGYRVVRGFRTDEAGHPAKEPSLSIRNN